MYITLSECIRGLNSTGPIALERDKVTGWHVTVFKGHHASVEEICAEVNLLDPNDTDIKTISELFQGTFSKLKMEDIIKRERASYEKVLRRLSDVFRNSSNISENIKSYKITNQSLLFDIALKAAAQDGWEISRFIENYGIEEEKKLYQIALKAAGQSGRGVSLNIQNYRFKDEELLCQIALKAAEQGDVSEYIQYYGIKNEERLYRIALKAAAQYGWGISYYIKNYGIEDQVKLYRIALKAAAQNGGGVSNFIQKFGIKNEESLFRIALRAIMQNAESSARYIENFGLESDLTSNLELFAESLFEPSKAIENDRTAFLSLIHKWRKEELPPFLHPDNPDPFVQQKLRKWIVELFFKCEGIANEQIEQERPLFAQMMQLRNPALRAQLIEYVPEVYANSEAWKALQAIPLKVPKKDYTQLARLLHLGLDPNTLAVFYSKLDDPFDQEIYLLFLLRIKALAKGTGEHLLGWLARQTNCKAMLHFMRTTMDILAYGHPELLTGDLDQQMEHLFLMELKGLKVANFKEAYENTLNKFRSKELIFTYLSSLRSQGAEAATYFKDIIEFILNGTFFDKRYDVPHLKKIFEKFPIEKDWRKGEKELTESDLLTGPVENQTQIPITLTEMRAKIITDNHLQIPDDSPLYKCLIGQNREECLKQLQSEIPAAKEKNDLKIQLDCLRLLDPALTEQNKSRILRELEQLCKNTQFQNDVKTWATLMSPVTSRSDYSISDTDDPNHLFLLGEEVSGSCQNITGGDPALNKGLLGYMLNGYNRAVVVTDKNGAIVARCLIRLYWDGEQPVLYQERFYTRSSDPKLKPLVNAMCLRRAKALNIPLVGAEGSKPYPKALEITGGRADIEYVDAIGGIQTSKHKVPNSYVLWEPS